MIDSPEIIKVLIDAGIDIDTRDFDGYTALMKTNSPDVAKLLIAAGADVNAVLPNSDNVNSDNVLMVTESAEIIRILASAGADLNAQNQIGATALMVVKSLDKIKALIESGADPLIEDINGDNAFTVYRLSHYDDSIELKAYLEKLRLSI